MPVAVVDGFKLTLAVFASALIPVLALINLAIAAASSATTVPSVPLV